MRHRSASRSSSSPSPPPSTSAREKRRSFSSRSPVSMARRTGRSDTSPLQSMYHPPESPFSIDEGPEGEGGFSTVYGASASSPPGVSGSEDEEDRFVSARGGDETEMEGRGTGRPEKRRSSGEEGDQLLTNGTGGGAGVLNKRNGSEATLTERISPPPSLRPVPRKTTLHPVLPAYTLLPFTIGGSRSRLKGKGKDVRPAWSIRITRRICEDLIVLGGVACGIWRLGWQWEEKALAGEIGLLVGLSVVYVAFRFRPTPKTAPNPRSPPAAVVSFHIPEKNHHHVRDRSSRMSMSHAASPLASAQSNAAREKVAAAAVEEVGVSGIGGRGCVWGTEEREYRDCLDDGVFFALLLGPMLAAAMLHSAFTQLSTSPDSAIHPGWAVEDPLVLASTPIRYMKGVLPTTYPSDAIKALSALATSRRNLVQLFTLCSFVLLVHLTRSLALEIKLSKQPIPALSSATMERDISDPNRSQTSTFWLRRGELRRNLSAVSMAFLVTGGCIVVKIATAYIGHGVWSDMSPSDIIIATLFYQFSLYVCVRLARRGFTLGELAIVCNAATALVMETVNMTRMKIRILRTPYIKTYRLPTPLLTFQLALIPGSILAGILLSPLLYLSRHLAQKPAHRLRFPHEKPVHRRLLALGFYGGAALVCGGLVGTWARWCLNWRDPWLWVVYWLFEGRRPWTRPVLISYWGALAAISVAGWSRQLTRARRHRRYVVPRVREPRENASSTPLPPGEGISGVATQMMDAADSRMPTLSVNSRRKFFHALAVVMFVPGIAVDPAFTHLSFSVAFAAFNFAEYVRYFALWPFGVSVHLFLNEFLDSKDSGTAILSHFYLLTGCASPLWLEGPSEILAYFGILSLGIGDALASIVGRRLGRLRWCTASGKTVEGSLAFFASVILASAALWAFGLVGDFKPTSYIITTALATLLEAFSAQNDNLVLPMYGWALGTLLGV